MLLKPTRNASKQVVSRSNWSRVAELEPTCLQAIDNTRRLVGAVGIEIRVSSILKDLRSTAGNGKKQLSIQGNA